MSRRLRMMFMRDLHECEEVRSLMSEYVDGELPEESRRRVARHIRFCRPCNRVLANLRHTLGRLSGLSSSSPPEADDEGQVAERLRAAWRERA